MSDVELLFLVLALIYVWECSNWVPLGATAFSTWLGSRWHRASPALRNQKGGFVLAPFLPPLGGILIANEPALLIYLFVFAPLAIARMGLTQTWPALLAGLYVLTFSIAFMFHSTHKHFYPAARDERFTHTLINMFSPATTIRARDLLSRPLLEQF